MSDPYEGMNDAEALRYLAKRYLRKPECVALCNRAAKRIERLEEVARLGHGLIISDLTGAQWKRACNDFCDIAMKSLDGDERQHNMGDVK